LIKGTKPEVAYQLYLLGEILEASVRELARSKRYVEHFGWQAQFTLFSLSVKAFQSALVEFGNNPKVTGFLNGAYPNSKWLTFCKVGVDHIRTIYQSDAEKYRNKTGEELTLANYFKSQTYTTKILSKPVPQQMKKLAKQLSRAGSIPMNGRMPKHKDPVRSAAAKLAWVNMRASRAKARGQRVEHCERYVDGLLVQTHS
jgi:hypothetical protein